MNGKRALVLSLAAFYLGHLVYYYPRLPERIASHFNHLGEPDGWMSKANFMIFEVVLLAFVLGLFRLISFSFEKMPISLINLPNKEYWLAPERRSETFRVLKENLETLQIALLAMLVSINQMAFRANIDRENLSPASWLVIGAFVIFTIIWTVKLNRKFKI